MCASVLYTKQVNWNFSENTVSILFVGDGFPVPLHSGLFTASPNPFGRISRLLREAKRLPYALTNSNLLLSELMGRNPYWTSSPARKTRLVL